MKPRTPARYRPQAAFPPYAYVPGRTPHPFRDPRGHGHGGGNAPPGAVAPADWRQCPAFLDGVDLFNHRFYWEAHEAWEGLWRQYPPGAPAAVLLQGLIRLAAAGVKAREGRPRGVVRHARAAGELFAGLPPAERIFGLLPGELAATARLAETPASGDSGLDLVLSPR